MEKFDNYPLLTHNTFGIKARARSFWEISEVDELQEALSDGKIARTKHLVIGRGSNLLFLGDYNGLLLHSALRGISIEAESADSVHLRVGSGEVWDEFVAHCVEKGWSGVENLSAIPGEVGAAAVQNIGAYGTEVCNCIQRVETLSMADGTPRTFSADECRYAYRSSLFKQEERGNYFVTYVHFTLHKGSHPQLAYQGLADLLPHGADSSLPEIRNAIIALRAQKLPDPAEWGNAGSFFMNPIVPEAQYQALLSQYPQMPSYKADKGLIKIPAAWLIEQCGWKGRTLGKAAVWERQPLVLINRGGATAADITRLADCITEDVRHKFGIDLHPEVNYIS